MRRPASGPVLLALSAREGQFPGALSAALSAALRDEHVARLVLGPLSEPEAIELIGDAATGIYPASGGNPFFLEQLARAGPRARQGSAIAAGESVPVAVAAALEGELAGLTPEARRLLDAAAVAGDPFELGLAAEVAELSDRSELDALDELLACALARPAGAPQLFAFRHPVVRHAVYGATSHGWRLGAHARAARALERSGAGPAERAHHVEQAARPGDEEAIDLLTEAARGLHSSAPASAAGFYAPLSGSRPMDPTTPPAEPGCRRCSPRRRPLPATRRARARRSSKRCAPLRPTSGCGSPSPRPTPTGCSGETTRPAAGSRWPWASCLRSRPRIASGCGWRSRSRPCPRAIWARRRPR